MSSACEEPIVGYLDAARETLGLGPYELPSGFIALAPAKQLLILANLDRIAYSLPPISGLSSSLDAAAATAAVGDRDPTAPSDGGEVGAADWSGGLPNVLEDYFLWMYADGFPGVNRDCPSPTSPGCWIHRRGILFTAPPSMMLTMGAANGVDPSGQAVAAILILATDPDAAPPEGYTWADAEAAGAGSPASSADARAPAGAGAASAGSTGAGGGSSAAGANSGAAAGSAPGVDSGAAGGGSGAGAAGSAGTGATYTAASDARPAASPALARPRIVSSRVNSRAHTVAFHVDGAGRSARLQCALIRETGAIPASGQFRQCGSRKRYTGLRPGIYDFFVRSFASAVDHSASAERRIEIS